MRFLISELENSSASGPLPSAHLMRGNSEIRNSRGGKKDTVFSYLSTISCMLACKMMTSSLKVPHFLT